MLRVPLPLRPRQELLRFCHSNEGGGGIRGGIVSGGGGGEGVHVSGEVCGELPKGAELLRLSLMMIEIIVHPIVPVELDHVMTSGQFHGVYDRIDDVLHDYGEKLSTEIVGLTKITLVNRVQIIQVWHCVCEECDLPALACVWVCFWFVMSWRWRWKMPSPS